MTLSQIIRQALRQLDEDPDDIDEYFDLFRQYANVAYDIITNDYLKPLKHFSVSFDDEGLWRLPPPVKRVEDLRDESGKHVMFWLTDDGKCLQTAFPARYRDVAIDAVCEVHVPELEVETDEPMLPIMGQQAIVDYLCYRHLMNGNLAKQSRANGYKSSFYESCSKMDREGKGSVTGFRNLYSASSIRG